MNHNKNQLNTEMESFLNDFEVKLRGHQSRLDHSREFISNNMEVMKKYGFENVVVWLLNNVNAVVVILLMFPELWKDFNKENWQTILINTNRPANLRLFKDERGYFDDIVFLFRFVKVDALKWVFENSLLSHEKKINIMNYFLMRPDELLKGDYDESGFNQGFFGNKEYIHIMQDRLIEQGLVKVDSEITEDPNQLEAPLEMVLAKVKTYVDNLSH